MKITFVTLSFTAPSRRGIESADARRGTSSSPVASSFRLERWHDRVLGVVEVLGGVLGLGRTAQVWTPNRHCPAYEPSLGTKSRNQGPPQAIATSRLLTLIVEKFLHLKSGHAPGASGRNGLPIAAILHVATSVDAGHPGEDRVRGHQIAL